MRSYHATTHLLEWLPVLRTVPTRVEFCVTLHHGDPVALAEEGAALAPCVPLGTLVVAHESCPGSHPLVRQFYDPVVYTVTLSGLDF